MTPFWQATLLSLEIAAAATAAVAVVGIPLACAMARLRFAGKSVIEGLFLVPMVLPPTVVGYLIIMALGRRGWLAGALGGYSIVFRIEGAILASAVVAFPMLYLPARSGFASIDAEVNDVARILGAGRWQRFWRVSLPLARHGWVSGVVLAFARALGEFGATVMVFGWQPGRLTLPISIYADYEQGDLAHAAAAVATLSLMSLGLIMLFNASANYWKGKD